MRNETRQFGMPKSARCNLCGSTRVLFSRSKITCSNCGNIIAQVKGSNKYGAKKTMYNGIKFDSKFEASVAERIEAKKLSGEILDYETQYKVEMWAYREDGVKAFKVNHKVDFRMHHKDGSFELVEAKGIETTDYKFRRKCLEELWLPAHKDHVYTVVKAGSIHEF